MSYNLVDLFKKDINKLNINLTASNVAFKKRYNMLMISDLVERE